LAPPNDADALERACQGTLDDPTVKAARRVPVS